MSGCGMGSLFGPSSQFIKMNSGDIISTEGSNIRERLILSDLRIPYKQILKSRVILKPGQVNYLMNHLGLGDNVTFLLVKAVYDSKSVIVEDNYLQWNYFDDFGKVYNMGNLLLLTGGYDPVNRIKQIYFTNPNSKYPVTLDIMVATVDDNYSIFTDTVNQSGLSFNNLKLSDIKTHIVNESIVIYSSDLNPVPICYINIGDISSMTKNDKIIIIYDNSIGSIYLDFKTQFDANQAFSILELVRSQDGIIIQELDPPTDIIDPVVLFKDIVYVPIYSTYSSPYDTSMGNTFSATMSFSTYATGSSPMYIDKGILRNVLVDAVIDNRDDEVAIGNSSLILKDSTDSIITNITTIGTYSLSFDILDYAENSVDSNKIVTINII